MGLYVQNADSCPTLVSVGNKLAMRVARLDFVPETVHLARSTWPIVAGMFCDVVEGNQPSTPYQRRVQLEIPLDASIRVVAVDKKIIERLPFEFANYGRMRLPRMRVRAQQEQPLIADRKTPIHNLLEPSISKTKRTSGQVNADNVSVPLSQSAQKEKR